MALLNSALRYGTAAARPAASTYLEGVYYFTTDTLLLYQCQSAAWVKIVPDAFANPMTTLGALIVGGAAGAPHTLPVGSDGKVLTADSGATYGISWQTPSTGGGGAMHLLDTVTCAGAQSTVTFNTISGAYKHLKVLANVILNGGTNALFLLIRLNNDTGNHYSSVYPQFTQAALTADGANIQDHGVLGKVRAETSDTAVASPLELLIPSYANNQFYKSWNSKTSVMQSPAASDEREQTCGGGWESTAAVTRIDIYNGATNFRNGCVFSLYGID